mmetsp:Transcript_91632/g.210026  ORF Transcript_91632/g.210026 Transcript_91632/m.210026 type:complete len:150 (-) Transcript_91632:34-483(-)
MALMALVQTGDSRAVNEASYVGQSALRLCPRSAPVILAACELLTLALRMRGGEAVTDHRFVSQACSHPDPAASAAARALLHLARPPHQQVKQLLGVTEQPGVGDSRYTLHSSNQPQFPTFDVSTRKRGVTFGSDTSTQQEGSEGSRSSD